MMISHNPIIEPKLLLQFLKNKGPLAGARSFVIYGSYVYFEKLLMK